MKKGFAPTNKDQKIWEDVYDEEYNGYGDEAAVIPTMNIFIVKKDKENNPVQAKSRIVVLGNHEKKIWSRED